MGKGAAQDAADMVFCAKFRDICTRYGCYQTVQAVEQTTKRTVNLPYEGTVVGDVDGYSVGGGHEELVSQKSRSTDSMDDSTLALYAVPGLG